MKFLRIFLLILIVIGIGLLVTQKKWVPKLVDYIVNKQNSSIGVRNTSDPKNTSYIIENQTASLFNGKSEIEIAPGSSSKIKTTTFGEPVYGDLNNDNKNDAAIFITQETGGSGTFFYVGISINVDGKYKGTKAIFLGDRIAPQNIKIENQTVIVNYAERKEGESFSTAPSVGVSKYLKFEKGEIVEIKK